MKIFFILFFSLLNTCYAQEASKSFNSYKAKVSPDFGGKWSLSEEVDYDGKSYTALNELYLAQYGGHVCGCWKKWGVPMGHEEFYSLEGRLNRALLDIWVDRGVTEDSIDETYRAEYPLVPVDVMRLKKTEKGLARAGISDGAFVIKHGFPKDEDVAYSTVRFFKRGADFSPEMCEEPGNEWRRFYEKCKEQTK